MVTRVQCIRPGAMVEIVLKDAGGTKVKFNSTYNQNPTNTIAVDRPHG